MAQTKAKKSHDPSITAANKARRIAADEKAKLKAAERKAYLAYRNNKRAADPRVQAALQAEAEQRKNAQASETAQRWQTWKAKLAAAKKQLQHPS